MKAFGSIAGLIACLVLILGAVWIWRPQQVAPASISAPVESNLADLIEERDTVLSALIPVTTERPLFHGTRKPPQTATPAAPAAPPKPTLSLVGILSDQDERIALLRISTSSELYRVSAGGQLADWRILEVGEDFVSVQEEDEAVVTLSMDAP